MGSVDKPDYKLSIHPDAKRQCGGWLDIAPFCGQCDRCRRENIKVRPELDEVVLSYNEAVAYARKLEIRLKLAEHAYERLNLCPDHRDKANGRCIVCMAEERTRQELAIRQSEAPPPQEK